MIRQRASNPETSPTPDKIPATVVASTQNPSHTPHTRCILSADDAHPMHPALFRAGGPPRGRAAGDGQRRGATLLETMYASHTHVIAIWNY